jgi:hypothetical protein
MFEPSRGVKIASGLEVISDEKSGCYPNAMDLFRRPAQAARESGFGVAFWHQSPGKRSESESPFLI